MVTENWSATGVSRLWRGAPGTPGSARTLVYERKTEDRYGDPGRAVTTRNARGRTVLQRSGDGTSKGLEPTVAALPALTRDSSATLLAVKNASGQVAATAERLNAKGGALDKLTQGGTALAASVETFSAATLPKLSEVADETARTMRQLRRTVSGVDDNPQSLIFGNGPRQPGPGEPGFSANGDKK